MKVTNLITYTGHFSQCTNYLISAEKYLNIFFHTSYYDFYSENTKNYLSFFSRKVDMKVNILKVKLEYLNLPDRAVGAALDQRYISLIGRKM